MGNYKTVLCQKCGSDAVLCGSDDYDTEGPWYVRCAGCGQESDAWAYPIEAIRQWVLDNPVI